ncbi:P-loop containing nucleoside triphosphate hydrolase protein [Protomyces lactucae-debilis]|uniref:p-loop containing nucleoside triphosphate hydrolase protein n=1 Tax=Protomyces lactucae-debilis TaxID=2754530 RepID=A0A1Y2FI67_PROLT|nr:P-loop containing nucleoside triphosphate hydrolase protein [Protomyces lactucae-debilis]ORY83648.1 P-loop containing nucleoside triphosphate hydrolase protein [Protomyces lactucae-debilis]
MKRDKTSHETFSRMAGQSQAGSSHLKNIKVSLSQALQHTPNVLETGLPTIDRQLRGGLVPGLLTEVYGPPGSGKTAFAMYMAAHILEDHAEKQGAATASVEPSDKDETLISWLECSQRLPATRLRDMISTNAFDTDVEMAKLSRVKTRRVASLPALMAMLLHAPDGDLPIFLTKDTKLLVIDDLTTLFNAAFPPEDSRSAAPGESQSARRARVTKLLAQTLQTLAASCQIIILVLCKLTTRVAAGSGATLVASLGDAWQDACSTRLLLYRDFPPVRLSADDAAALRYCAVQKVGGAMLARPEGVPVRIVGSGFQEMDLDALSRSVGTQRFREMHPPPETSSTINRAELPVEEPPSVDAEVSEVLEPATLESSKRPASETSPLSPSKAKRFVLEEVRDSEEEDDLDEVALEEEAERAI